MVQTLQAKNVTLGELRDHFGLGLTENERLFREWQDNLPELTGAEKQRLDRVKASFFNLLEYPPLLENTVNVLPEVPSGSCVDFVKMVVLSPLLDLADVYLKPLHIKSEQAFQIVTEDKGTEIKGAVDVLVLCDRLWVMVIEAKRAAVDIDEGRAQLLSYMLTNPMPERPTFGMITNGRNFLFVKLVRQPTPQYALSRLFSMVNPGNELYTVLGVLKQLVQMVQLGSENGAIRG